MNYLRFLQDTRKMNEAGSEVGDAGGGPENPPAKKAAPAPAAGITPEIQAMIDAAVGKAVSANDARRDTAEAGLKKNKEELHAEKKALQQQLKDNENRIRMKEGNVEDVTKEIKAQLTTEYAEKFADHEKQIANFQTEKHNNTIEAFVDDIVDQSNIKPAFKRARKLEIMADSKIVTDESGKLTIDGRNPKEFVSNWLENGQHVNDYVLAPTSNGGGAKGAKGNAGAGTHAQALEKHRGGNLFAVAAELVNKQ